MDRLVGLTVGASPAIAIEENIPLFGGQARRVRHSAGRSLLTKEGRHEMTRPDRLMQAAPLAVRLRSLTLQRLLRWPIRRSAGSRRTTRQPKLRWWRGGCERSPR